MDQDNTQETTPTEQPTANLSLQDLLLVVQTIQVVTQRGAFRAEELSNIGGLYNRLVEFLTASGAIKPAESPAADTPADDTTAQES